MNRQSKEMIVKELDGKVALVTGSAHGIGKAIAIALADRGANIVLADKDTVGMQSVAKSIVDLGVQAEAIPTDVTDEQQIDNLFDKTVQRFGRVDILVNNAGLFGASPIDEMSTETWDRLIAVDLRGPFMCTRSAFRIMKKQGGGRIINIGSISAQRVRPNNAAYSVAKFGLVGLTHTTALEGRKYGINCGILHPGEVLHEGRPREMQKEPAMTPEQIAAAAAYMACQPPGVNVLELIQLNPLQPYVGRG
jgi:NAD(P)-dependent dehydrogenase (short-subunit alcohol dehydrogenase family)